MRYVGTMRVSVLVLLAGAYQAAGLPSAALQAGPDSDRFSLPAGLLVGAGVSALQSEGAWNISGKAESAGDHIIHALGKETFPVFHDVAADSYHKFRDDVAMAAKLKLKLYKFSMSWARILPTAEAKNSNSEGVKFYHDLITEIKTHNMTPMVILYHFDHPQILEEQFMGWQDRKMVAKFAEYARFVFDEYGKEVDIWASINEPNMYCTYFNLMYVEAKLRQPDEIDMYTCSHNNILAHKEAYKIFKEGRASGKYKGKLGFTSLIMHGKPATTSAEDVYAADSYNLVQAGLLLHPVVYGDYPEEVKILVGSKLPEFTPDEKKDLKDSTDFIGFNVYFGIVVTYKHPANSTLREGGGGAAGNVMMGVIMAVLQDLPFVNVALGGGGTDPSAAFTSILPDVMTESLLWTHQLYKKPLIICENGFGDSSGYGVHDHQRAAYHSAFLRAVVTSVKDFGVDVLAYAAWSLVDSFEFTAGYDRPFGLVHVDYESGSLERSLKDSAFFWTELADTGVVPYVEPDQASTTVPPSSTPKPSSSAAPNASWLLLTILALLARL